ncbi:glutathione S-transferase [Apodospora peruviana]|uniref:Glutathione S-transferase n=1 Tax=Apodospora peruviana TaxID=516989 RepID=A0AAE0IHT7_9PEZI|nr:glutathione S-transferase [Apodospora peruviana]
MSSSSSNIHLYTAQTPNGIKVSMLLEELDLPYKVTQISLSKNEQKEPWFLEINPNGRIPALTDTLEDGTTPINLFESGSIMQYLVDRYDADHKVSYPRGTPEYWEVNHWLFWQMGGLGPMQGQAHHFYRYAPEKITYGINRYQNETRRLYGVMETQLAKSKSGYLVGDRLTIADLSCWGWVAAYHRPDRQKTETNTMAKKQDWAGVEIDEFPHLSAWLEKVLARPGVEKGRNVPEKHTSLDFKKLSKEELDKRAAESWVRTESTAK